MSDCQDCCCTNLENENTLAIEMRKSLQKQPPKGVLQICI